MAKNALDYVTFTRKYRFLDLVFASAEIGREVRRI